MPPAHQRIRASPPNFAANPPQILEASRRGAALLGQAWAAAQPSLAGIRVTA
jgi:hypothetical protein